MAIPKHHFINSNNNKVSVYYYEDRYRYIVITATGIEYRELCKAPFVDNITDPHEIELLIEEDCFNNPYKEQQLKPKCIRCSKPFGAPRREYNLAPICNRCYSVMEQTDDTSLSEAHVWYEINPDGSKGSVIK